MEPLLIIAAVNEIRMKEHILLIGLCSNYTLYTNADPNGLPVSVTFSI
jgi:hypothetical protein